MAIETTYKEVLLEQYIKEELAKGNEVTTSEILTFLNGLEDYNLSIPQFQAADYYVGYKENASASKFKNTFSRMQNDLAVLYEEMLKLSHTAVLDYERWNMESNIIEKELINLENRIDNLLILAQDTEGYHSILVDNFNDSRQIDFDYTTCQIDLNLHRATLKPTGGVSTRIFLNNILEAKDVSFKIQSTASLLGRTDLEGTEVVDIFRQGNKGWLTSIAMKQAGAVTCELNVKLGSAAVNISKVSIVLHDSVQAGTVQITPLYSTDNVNWFQFATTTFTQEVRSSCVFSFPETSAQWIKFILTKKGPDPGSSSTTYNYQFGFKEIAFFQEGFSADLVQQFISKPLVVLDPQGDPIEFEKLTLTVCEGLETDTDINYYITTSDNYLVPIDGSTVWVPINPLNRVPGAVPQILTVGDSEEYIYGDDETVVISYDGTNADPNFTNPAQVFHLLVYNLGTETIDDTTVSGIDKRYTFKNLQDRILNYQIDPSVELNPTSFVVLRNMGTKGLNPSTGANQVRGVARGWGFTDPWYNCVVYIKAQEGIELDIGDSPILIDDVRYTGKVSKTVLSYGFHSIKVHKDNWKYVETGATTLAQLKTRDQLYPYNHKLLIEGYLYDAGYTEEEVYNGVDIFSEYAMQEVSLFNFLNNIDSNRYDLYALDNDAPATHAVDSTSSRVVLVKSDITQADAQNERFGIIFRLNNELRKYLRLRVDLETSNEKVTPVFAGYKIKVGQGNQVVIG